MRPKQTPKARHDDELADCFSDDGRPAEPVRFMLGMFMFKHAYGLSDEQVWDRWVHGPYFQYFTGEAFFQHELPHERSGMSLWRGRIGDKLDILLPETLRIKDFRRFATRYDQNADNYLVGLCLAALICYWIWISLDLREIIAPSNARTKHLVAVSGVRIDQ